ncbi:NAD-dependent succinate-semialdehyde dehydrogenase [Leucobacter komagatae]|uniref:Succinate-semialdehyde dehydrogenase n=1 Tax=Leucobacter komagatae TaxID=55969 RepID=A0A0D0HVL2_9MICO|nr:NAD-dependent succinate-semialdehyde dehydrogenase [Leucobacter komagatae]KIP51636.1 succinate-semialdehyde dehydrogenase [Leucobacter komagatae]
MLTSSPLPPLDAASLETGLLIDGEFRPARSSRTINVLDPSTGELIAAVADAGDEEVADALAAARSQQAAWAATSPRARADILMRTFEIMMEERERLARLISWENGKALPDARGEVAYAAEFFRWYAEEAPRMQGTFQRSPGGANNILVDYAPVGVALLVTPWNFPAAMATRKIAPALAAGCTAILKPAKETPLTALAIGEILVRAGVPAGVVNILTTSRSGPVVSALLDDPAVRVLSFTGSTEVGRVLLAEAARTVVKPAMELGGNAPFVVLADADVELALDGAMVAKMRNGGQACTAANRFIVHESLAERFAAGLAERFAALTIGVGYEEGVDLGPLVNEASVVKVQALVDDAVAHGARVLTGGSRPDTAGSHYSATVLVDVPTEAAITREEIFGPVAAITSFSTDEEAIEMANSTEYGLVSYLFTADLQRGLTLSRQLDSGMVGLNRGLVSDAAAPFGGTKQSGLGREGAREGLLEYLEQRYIAVDW